MEGAMFVPDERLLCLHAADGKENLFFRCEDESYDPPIGSTDRVVGYRFRVIRRAQVEPCLDGNSYWVIHALRLAQTYH